MYVAKFGRSGLLIKVTLFDKYWSDEMVTHQVRELGCKKFLFRFAADHWVRNEIVKDIVRQHKLEII